jgi:hypothetical protein
VRIRGFAGKYVVKACAAGYLPSYNTIEVKIGQGNTLQINLSKTGKCELSHDFDRPSCWVNFFDPKGHLVSFSSPVSPWYVQEVKIFANRYGSEPTQLRVELWNSRMERIHESIFPNTMFSSTPRWVSLSLPNVKVEGDFYVALYPRATAQQGINVFYDSTVTNQHSDLLWDRRIAKDWVRDVSWGPGYIPPEKESTNWMIRVIGDTASSSQRQITTARSSVQPSLELDQWTYVGLAAAVTVSVSVILAIRKLSGRRGSGKH